jgi:hypothetical protein
MLIACERPAIPTPPRIKAALAGIIAASARGLDE